MGGQMWHLLEAQAKALGEELELQHIRAIAKGLSTALGDGANVETITRKFEEMLTPKSLDIGFLTRKELQLRWRVSKHIIRRYEKMGMPIAQHVGRRPRYDWKGVEKWRGEVLNGERVGEDGTGGCARGTLPAMPEKSASTGRQRTERSLPLERRRRLDLLSSYGNSRRVQHRTT